MEPPGTVEHGRPSNTWRRDVDLEARLMEPFWGTVARLAQDRNFSTSTSGCTICMHRMQIPFTLMAKISDSPNKSNGREIWKNLIRGMTSIRAMGKEGGEVTELGLYWY